jgi:hypothetical protein
MPSDPGAPIAKSPLLAAAGISLAIALGAVLGTTDIATLQDALSGRWLMRSYTETLQGHTVAIAALESSIGGVSRDIDFVASRADAAVRRNEDRTVGRLAQIDTEIAALKEKLLGVQLTQLISSRTDTLGAPAANDATGLRSSLTELSAAHHNSVAAITRRLDRIEVKVGLSTDVTAPVASSVRKSVRRAVRMRRPTVPPPTDTTWSSPLRLDQGHLFNVKPVSQQRRPLRLTRLPD